MTDPAPESLGRRRWRQLRRAAAIVICAALALLGGIGLALGANH